jgi:hypothetical protein
MVAAVSGHPLQPAVTVAGTTQAAVMQLVQIAVVDTTAAQPDTDSSDSDSVIWARAGPALGRC